MVVHRVQRTEHGGASRPGERRGPGRGGRRVVEAAVKCDGIRHPNPGSRSRDHTRPMTAPARPQSGSRSKNARRFDATGVRTGEEPVGHRVERSAWSGALVDHAHSAHWANRRDALDRRLARGRASVDRFGGEPRERLQRQRPIVPMRHMRHTDVDVAAGGATARCCGPARGR